MISLPAGMHVRFVGDMPMVAPTAKLPSVLFRCPPPWLCCKRPDGIEMRLGATQLLVLTCAFALAHPGGLPFASSFPVFFIHQGSLVEDQNRTHVARSYMASLAAASCIQASIHTIGLDTRMQTSAFVGLVTSYALVALQQMRATHVSSPRADHETFEERDYAQRIADARRVQRSWDARFSWRLRKRNIRGRWMPPKQWSNESFESSVISLPRMRSFLIWSGHQIQRVQCAHLDWINSNQMYLFLAGYAFEFKWCHTAGKSMSCLLCVALRSPLCCYVRMCVEWWMYCCMHFCAVRVRACACDLPYVHCIDIIDLTYLMRGIYIIRICETETVK